MPTTFTLADPPGPLPLPELTCSNQQASLIERLALENALHEVLQKEAEIDQVLQVVQARKQEYTERAALLRLGLAPCRILPQEIWSRIFCIVMDIEDIHKTAPTKIRGRVDDDVPPWAAASALSAKGGKTVIGELSLVCRMWRRAVLAEPSMWRHLPSETMFPNHDPNVDYGEEGELVWRTRYNYALQTHLSYAGSMPLRMCAIVPPRGLDLPANVEYLQLLTKALPRLGFLNLTITGDAALSRFSALPQYFDNLKALSLTVSYEVDEEKTPIPPATPWLILNHCPLLSEMELFFLTTGGAPAFHSSLTDWVQIPSWSHLTRIHVRNLAVVDIFRILKTSSKLVDATFSIGTMTIGVPSDTETTIVACPALHTLEMHLHIPQFHPYFTHRLHAPALTHLLVSIPTSIQVHMALPVRPACLNNITHLVFTNVHVFWNTQQWVDLLTSTPNVTHLKLSYFGGIGHLLQHLADITIAPILVGLKMLMIDGVTVRDPYYGATADEDAITLGLQVSALTAARFQQFPSSGSVVRNPMTALKIAFAKDDHATKFHACAFYRWNGWASGSASECPIYARLDDTFTPIISILYKFYDLPGDHPDIAPVSELLSHWRFKLILVLASEFSP